MTSPNNPLNNKDAARPTGGYNFDALAKKDVQDLESHEAEALAYFRSNASLEDYDPDKVAPEERVVETPDHASLPIGDLAKDKDVEVSIRNEAQGVIDTVKESRDTSATDAPKTETAKPASTK